MNNKKAKLVVVSPIIRIIVDQNESQESIENKVIKKLLDQIETKEILENIDCIFDDNEQPYDPEIDEK